MKCPNCSHEWKPDRDEVLSEYARLGGSVTSRAKARAAKRNAKLGGWPKGKKRGQRKRARKDANQLAHSIVGKAAKLTVQTERGVCEDCGAPHGESHDKGCPQAHKPWAKLQGRPPRRLKVLPSPKSPKRGH